MDSEAAFWRAPKAVATEVNMPVRDKGKRKIVDSVEAEQSFKFQVDPLMQKEVFSIEAKRKQCDRRNTQRQREKRRMEETEKELHELKEQLWQEQELHG